MAGIFGKQKSFLKILMFTRAWPIKPDVRAEDFSKINCQWTGDIIEEILKEKSKMKLSVVLLLTFCVVIISTSVNATPIPKPYVPSIAMPHKRVGLLQLHKRQSK